MEDADGSSVRIKVAQYFVNEKLQDLDDKKPLVNLNKADLAYLEPLPLSEPTDGTLIAVDSSSHPVDVSALTSPLPIPLRWDELLKHVTSFEPEAPGSSFTLVLGPWHRVAIIGAGVAGLRTAKLLQREQILYKIFEASDRPGGRVFTYKFHPSNPGAHDYYDVGAMRFPNNKANKRTFDLFEELGLSNKLIEYVMSNEANIRYFNNIKKTAKDVESAGNHFNDEHVDTEYWNKEVTDLRGKKVYGINACTAAAYDPFRKDLIENFESGWDKLMVYDWASTRGYLARELTPKPYPLPVVHWMENRNSGTGGFDRAFSEAILDSLEFDDPTADIKWRCLEGGSRVLVDAMVDALNTKPDYGQRVTAVKQVWVKLYLCLPNPSCSVHRQRDRPIWPPLPDQPPWPSCPFNCSIKLWHLLPLMKVSVSGKSDEYFSHVVSTVPFADLNIIDTESINMTYLQRQAIRTLNYGPAVKVAIKFKSRWWEQPNIDQKGGSSYTDRPSRVIVYPSYGIGENGPGVLMVTYNWHQDASRYGALIKNPDWSDVLDPGRVRPWSEKVLLDQIYSDLAVIHGVDEKQLRDDTLDYHPFDWYHNPYTSGAYAHFAPGQFSTFFSDIVQSASHGRFHFAGEVASFHHAWVAGALDSAVRVVDEILRRDWRSQDWRAFRKRIGLSYVFSGDNAADEQYVRGIVSTNLEKGEGRVGTV